MKSKTLHLIHNTLTLLEQGQTIQGAPTELDIKFGDQGADATVPPPNAPSEGEPEIQKLTSQGEVNMIKKLVTLIQTAITSEPSEDTKTMIVNFDVDSIKPENARDMLKKFEQMLISNKSDFETTNIDNKYGL